jgi:hypothetical protein
MPRLILAWKNIFRTGPIAAVLHGSGAARNATYPRRNSGGALEVGAANFGHPVKDPDANLGLCQHLRPAC